MTRIFLNSPSQEENWHGGITDHDWRKGTSITVEQFCLCQVRSPMDRSEGAQLLLKVRLTAALWAHPRLYMWCVRPSWAVSAIQGAPTTPGPDVWKQADFKARQHSAYIPRWKLFFFFFQRQSGFSSLEFWPHIFVSVFLPETTCIQDTLFPPWSRILALFFVS